MKFFFECVTCFSVATHSSVSSTSSEEPTTTTTEESSSLVVRRRRKRTSTRGSSAEWKPSLHMISEDIVVATPKKVTDRKPVSPVASSKSSVKRFGHSSAHVNDRSLSHDFSREPLPMAFPAFSAAPFMF